MILKDLPEKITKSDIKIWISHFVEPAYVDLNQAKHECIIRFAQPIFAESFVNKFFIENEKKINNHPIQIEILEGEEEDKYISKVENLKKEFQDKKSKKKYSQDFNQKKK